MTEEVRNRIFDPYFTSEGLGAGTGPVLAVVHGIINKDGGHIEVASSPGKGSTLTILLPRSSDTSHLNQHVEELPKLPPGDESILIVDDDEAIVTITRRILTNLGYRTTIFMDSCEAFNSFSKDPERFNIVITDMTMPVMTGAELSEKLLAIRPDLPIILCTGYNDLINETRTKNIGIRNFLMKPATVETLTTTVRGILDSQGKNSSESLPLIS